MMNQLSDHNRALTSVASQLSFSDSVNTYHNIISGPKPLDYFFHSPNLQQPEINTNGPFPIQGNIGSLLKQESINNYSSCGSGPDVEGSPNCTGVFVPDVYTKEDTCGQNCKLKYPESYGVKDFGFDPSDSVKLTNAHQVHAFVNLRAGMPAQTATYGCYENIPRLTPNNIGTCEMNQVQGYSQVGEWNKLPLYSSLQTSKTMDTVNLKGSNFSSWVRK